MKFMTLVKSSERNGPPPKVLMEEIAKLAASKSRHSRLLMTGGLLGSHAGARVRVENGTVSVTDGPFTEARELVGGFAIIEADSRAECVKGVEALMELHRKHWPGWVGETEIRQVYEGQPGDFPVRG